jgi:hypothetical protein
MKINKKVKVAVGSFLGVVLFLFIILVAHVATAKRLDSSTIQVSRIDFDKPFDSISKIEIEKNIRSIPGVKSEVIVKRNVVVYFHDNRVADSKKVFGALMKKGNYNAKPFILPAGLENKQVCPVMNHNSFYYKFSTAVQRIFN